MLKEVAKTTKKDLDRLAKVAARYKEVTKKLQKAQENLANLREQKRSYVEGVRDAALNFTSFSAFERPQDVFGNVEDWSVGNIKSQLTERLNTVKRWGTNLKKMLQMGFSKNLYDQVVQMGPEAGALFSDALIQATPAEIGELNTLGSQAATIAQDIAATAGSQMYDAGIKAAEGLVKGLQERKAELQKVAEDLGKQIAQAIKKALKIKSPSGVGADIGSNFASAVAMGMRAQTNEVSAAATLLGRAMQFDPTATYSGSGSPYGYAPPVVGAGNTVPPAGKTVEVKVEQTINTQEIDPRKQAADLGWEVAQKIAGLL
jgi:hypothetical protein